MDYEKARLMPVNEVEDGTPSTEAKKPPVRNSNVIVAKLNATNKNTSSITTT